MRHPGIADRALASLTASCTELRMPRPKLVRPASSGATTPILTTCAEPVSALPDSLLLLPHPAATLTNAAVSAIAKSDVDVRRDASLRPTAVSPRARPAVAAAVVVHLYYCACRVAHPPLPGVALRCCAIVTASGSGLFDCHHHVGDVSAFLGVDMPGGGVASELDARLAIMDAAGVGQAAVIPSHAYERPDGIADTRSVNDGIAAYRDARPDRFPVAIGIVEPQH